MQLWAEKPACDVAPFLYQSITLDSAGSGTHDITHGGSTLCSENLLGRWNTWLVDGAAQSNTVELVFSNTTCADAGACAAARSFCPAGDDEPLIPRDELFLLSAEARVQFTPPPDWVNWGTNYEDYQLRELWEAFDEGRIPVPLDPDSGPAGWYEEDGVGSQNHALLWMGESALAFALADNAAQYENAAQKCLRLLELDTIQGHMRHEAIGGYAGFWEGGIAAMVLAGMYAPAGSTSGPALLAAARAWWADHVAVLRALSMPDGQVALCGARMSGEPGTEDSWSSLSSAVNLQLIDARPWDQLHRTIRDLLTAEGEPAPGTGGVPVKWYRPRHVAERWIVLRAVQSGAVQRPPADQPAPSVVQNAYRWTAGGRVNIGLPRVVGYRPARWHVSWTAGSVVRVEIGDASDVSSGKGLTSNPPGHLPPTTLNIPQDAEHLFGP